MSIIYSDQYSLRREDSTYEDLNMPTPQFKGQIMHRECRVTATAAWVAADEIYFCKMPAGAKLASWNLWGDDFDSTTNATGELGYLNHSTTDDPNAYLLAHAFLQGTAQLSSGGSSALTVVPLTMRDFTVDTNHLDLALTIVGTPTTNTTGVLVARFEYFMP